MEITEEVLRANIVSIERQLARTMEETAMLRGGIVVCNQLLLHLEQPDLPSTAETDQEPPTLTLLEKEE